MVKYSIGFEFAAISGAGLGMLICLLFPYWPMIRMRVISIVLFAVGLIMAYTLNVRILMVFSLLALLAADAKDFAKRPIGFWIGMGLMLAVWWFFWISALKDGFWWGIIP